jgi:hypothetical protein
MKTSRTYEALGIFVHGEFERMREDLTEAIVKARKSAGKEDEYDVTLALANKLSLYGLDIATQLHTNTLENTRTHESLQLELPFPPN